MDVDDLSLDGLAHAHVALHATVRQTGRGGGREVLFAPCVAPGAEIRSIHGTEAEAVFIVVARRAQPAAELSRGRVAHEPASGSCGSGEAVRAQRLPRSGITVERSELPRGEVLAGQRLLVLRLVAASALAVLDRTQEVRVPIRRMALS